MIKFKMEVKQKVSLFHSNFRLFEIGMTLFVNIVCKKYYNYCFINNIILFLSSCLLGPVIVVKTCRFLGQIMSIQRFKIGSYECLMDSLI